MNSNAASRVSTPRSVSSNDSFHTAVDDGRHTFDAGGRTFKLYAKPSAKSSNDKAGRSSSSLDSAVDRTKKASYHIFQVGNQTYIATITSTTQNGQSPKTFKHQTTVDNWEKITNAARGVINPGKKEAITLAYTGQSLTHSTGHIEIDSGTQEAFRQAVSDIAPEESRTNYPSTYTSSSATAAPTPSAKPAGKPAAAQSKPTPPPAPTANNTSSIDSDDDDLDLSSDSDDDVIKFQPSTPPRATKATVKLAKDEETVDELSADLSTVDDDAVESPNPFSGWTRPSSPPPLHGQEVDTSSDSDSDGEDDNKKTVTKSQRPTQPFSWFSPSTWGLSFGSQPTPSTPPISTEPPKPQKKLASASTNRASSPSPASSAQSSPSLLPRVSSSNLRKPSNPSDSDDEEENPNWLEDPNSQAPAATQPQTFGGVPRRFFDNRS